MSSNTPPNKAWARKKPSNAAWKKSRRGSWKKARRFTRRRESDTIIAMPTGQPCLEIFAQCVEAIRANKLITRESRQDKEFHFQNWFKARLTMTKLNFEVGGRNTYPDFRLVASTDGFEVKGLAYPGREANYD